MTTDANTQAPPSTPSTPPPDGTQEPPAPTVEELTTLRQQIADLEASNSRLGESLKTATLANLSPEQRANAERLLKDLEEKATQTDQATQLEERARELRAKELAFEYKDYGVTAESLKGVTSVVAMEAAALRVKADYLEKNGKPNGAVNPATLNSDKSSANGGGSSTPSMEGVKGRDGVAAHLGQLFREKHGTS